MSALQTKHDPTMNAFYFEQNQAIPSYLIAIAVGHLASYDLSERIRVWTEPSMLGQCQYEFEESERFLTAAEQLLGEYQWKRYDFLVLPPSFPCKFHSIDTFYSNSFRLSRWRHGKSMYEFFDSNITCW